MEWQVQAPDGSIYTVNTPEPMTDDEIIEAVMRQHVQDTTPAMGEAPVMKARTFPEAQPSFGDKVKTALKNLAYNVSHEEELYKRSALYSSLKDAFLLPGRAYRGEIDPYSGEAVMQAQNLAGWLTLSEFGKPVTGTRESTLGSGAVRTKKIPMAEQPEMKAATGRLKTLADRMEAEATESLGQQRLANTPRRVRMAASAEEGARQQVALAKTIRNVSNAIDTGQAENLKGIKYGSDVELLNRQIRQAKIAQSRAGGTTYTQQLALEEKPATLETLNFAPGLPKWKISDEQLVSLTKLEPAKKFEGALKALPVDERGWATVPDDLAREIFSTLKSYDKSNKLTGWKSTVPWQLKEYMQEAKAFERMGIDTPEKYRAALNEFLQFRSGVPQADKIVAMERELVGTKQGIDFFPTPKPVADRMVQMAEVKPGMKVLEPSAGTGNIAESIRKAGVEPDVGEISTQLRDILQAKKFKVVSDDFMDLKTGDYDAIVMNPPFSKNQDIQHIEHAYELLKPGGKLVSVVDEGAFFRGGKTETAFRDWLISHNASIDKLPPGTFADKSLLQTTGTNARLITLTKPAAAAVAPTAAITQAAKRAYGVTDNWKEAGYITEDGSLLDLSGRSVHPEYKRMGNRFVPKPGQSDWLSGQRALDHRQIPETLETVLTEGKEMSGGQMMRTLMNKGKMIRMQSNGFETSYMPSAGQWKQIKQHLIDGDEPFFVDVSPAGSSEVFASKEFTAGTSIAEVRKFIDTAIRQQESMHPESAARFMNPAEVNKTLPGRTVVDKPMAASGLTSYRYQGEYGDIAIGAKNTRDALREVARSVSGKIDSSKLQVWRDGAYRPIEIAKTLADVQTSWDQAGFDSFISEGNGVITVHKIVLPKSQRGQGKGTQAMQQLIDYADSTNQRIELTPTAEFGGTSKARLVRFYRGMGFVPNKGKYKDFRTRETMYREPE